MNVKHTGTVLVVVCSLSCQVYYTNSALFGVFTPFMCVNAITGLVKC
jgi:hypothetical protein